MEIWPFIAENFPLETAVKPLQMETWLLLTAYGKSPAPYPMVPSLTPNMYCLATIPHDWHSIVRYDPSRSSKINNLCHLKAMGLPISDQ